MKENNNIEFDSLLQNEELVRLLNENPIEADRIIEELCSENPDKERSIRFAKQVISHYRAEQLDVDSDKITTMWNNILHRSKNRKPTHIFRNAQVWQIAASVAILLSLTLYFYEFTSNNSIRKFAETKVAISDEARIIKSNGVDYMLKFNNSHIKYDADGKEIVIEEQNDQIKKLNNQPEGNKNSFNQLVVPYGKRYTVTLCDGTFVQLNSGSKLVFPAKFQDRRREVFLVGEGYFEVAKDANKPFIVITDFMNVKVLGTHFNVSAYENEESAFVVLVEGNIEVYNNNFFKSNRTAVKPGEGCFITDYSSKFKIQKVDISEYVSWKDGFFKIKDKPLADITKKIEKYYNKTILIKDGELAHRIISGKLVLDVKIEKTLDFLAKATKSQWKLKEDGIYVFME